MQPSLALLSQRSNHLREAGILRQLTLEVQAYADGINLGQGVCDLDMPHELREAATRSMHHDRATYTPYAGIPEVREAIAARMQTRYGLNYGPQGVCVTVGSSMAYSATLFTLLDPGDEIVLPEGAVWWSANNRCTARAAGPAHQVGRGQHAFESQRQSLDAQRAGTAVKGT